MGVESIPIMTSLQRMAKTEKDVSDCQNESTYAANTDQGFICNYDRTANPQCKYRREDGACNKWRSRSTEEILLPLKQAFEKTYPPQQ